MVPLGEVAEIERKGVAPDGLPPETPYLGLEHIERGGRVLGRSSVGEADLKSTKFYFTERHVLYGKLRPNLGKISRPDFAGVCSTDILPIQPGPNLDRGFLAHYLAQPTIVDFAASRATGANLPRLSPASLSQIPVPLPPLDEQRRIAAILDQTDALRAKRREVLAHLNTLTQSIFHDMFGEPSSWSGRWSMGTIGEMVESVQYGSASKAGSNGEWAILRMGNVTDDGFLDLSDLKYLDLTDSDLPKYTVRRGDLLFNRTNSKEKVGKAAVVRTDEPLAFAGYLLRARFKSGFAPEFVSAYLGSTHGRATRRCLAKEAVNQANISATEFRKIPIAMPPADLQAEFAARIEEIIRRRQAGERAITTTDTLFASLQSRAFNGGLS